MFIWTFIITRLKETFTSFLAGQDREQAKQTNNLTQKT